VALSDLVAGLLYGGARRRPTLWVVGLLLASPRPTQAQSALTVDLKHLPGPAMRIAFDADDDDDDGVADYAQSERIKSDELRVLRLRGLDGSAVIRSEGPVRLVVNGAPVASATDRDVVLLQATGVSERADDAALVVVHGGREQRIGLTSVGLHWLDAQNQSLLPAQAVLGVSRSITHDRSLPREIEPDVTSPDPENVRVEVTDVSTKAAVVYAQLSSRDAQSKVTDTLRHLALHRVGDTQRFRSGFVRLVADATDESAPEVADQVLRVRLRDRVALMLGDPRAPLTQDIFVGRAGPLRDERSVLRGKLRISVLRLATDGESVLGEDAARAERLSREQVVIANEIWSQCFIDFGRPEATEVHIVDPPPPALLAVSDLDGLPAAGDGQIRFMAGDKRIGPIRTTQNASPRQTAEAIVKALNKVGFSAHLSPNPRTENGADRSCDVIVQNSKGKLVRLSADGRTPLSTDTQQTVQIGRVDLGDGIQEFDNDVSANGTLEERTLVKLLVDRDPETVDVLLINHFVSTERQGEAFIESDDSDMANVLIFDRNAVRYQRQAWVQAHELGHILLDEPFHPDNLGPDRSYLLMDSDARQGRVTGPKRLSEAECKRARRRSGPTGKPTLLRPVNPGE